LKLIERRIMYKDRGGFGGGSSRSEIVGGPLDRKRINDALDKHLEKSSPSTSRGLNNSSKDKERLSVPSTSTGKSSQHQQHLEHHRADSRSASLSKNKCSDGSSAFSWFFVLSLIMSLFLCVLGSGFLLFLFIILFVFFGGIDWFLLFLGVSWELWTVIWRWMCVMESRFLWTVNVVLEVWFLAVLFWVMWLGRL